MRNRTNKKHVIAVCLTQEHIFQQLQLKTLGNAKKHVQFKAFE